MQRNNNILDELKSLSDFVATIPYTNVYTVEANYFNNLEEDVKSQLFLSALSNKNEATVPEGYFENLSSSILQKIKASEHKEQEYTSTLLSSIGNKNVYEIPKGFFEQLIYPKNTRVVKIGTSNVFKYAAAAVITGLLGFGIFTYTSNTEKNDVAIINTSNIKAGNEILKTNSFDNELALLSEKDVESYLTDNGEDINAALVATTVNDENTILPKTEDYFLDDNTLDDFLKENNLTN
jgi:hypothetical protein